MSRLNGEMETMLRPVEDALFAADEIVRFLQHLSREEDRDRLDEARAFAAIQEIEQKAREARGEFRLVQERRQRNDEYRDQLRKDMRAITRAIKRDAQASGVAPLMAIVRLPESSTVGAVMDDRD